MQDWLWVISAVAIAAHAEQVAERGGDDGIRDEDLLDSGLGRPMHLAGYGQPDAADLAAAYAFGIARRHPFVDGNKRTAAVVSETFLMLNGSQLTATDAELVVAFVALAGANCQMKKWLIGSASTPGRFRQRSRSVCDEAAAQFTIYRRSYIIADRHFRLNRSFSS